MSIETLEQKKMLLPYLEKIEYINYQLQCVRYLHTAVFANQGHAILTVRGWLPTSLGCAC